MLNKRHALELLELFKQSRLNASIEARADAGEVKAGGGPDEMKVEGFSRSIPETVIDSSPSTSYLPKITTVPKKPPVMNVRKDTIIVGAVFVLVLSGLSFLLGRRTGILAPPPAGVAAAIPEEVPIEIDEGPISVPVAAAVEKAPEAVAPPAAPKAETKADPAPEKTDVVEKEYVREYQVSTCGDNQEGADEYREFLLGMGYEARSYCTSGGQWTVRVRSYDETMQDLEKIKGLTYHNHRPFETAFPLRRPKKSD